MTIRVPAVLAVLTACLSATAFAADETRGGTSAATLIQLALEEGGVEKAVDEFMNLRSRSPADTYFDENEFNFLGYSLIGSGRIKEALCVLEMNADLFPESANVFDSLGEAYMLDGNRARAAENYEKSLEIDPGNENARFILKRINGHIHDALAETRAPMTGSPGEGTGLAGDYLGQEPPGLTPKVFAPGVVSTRGNFEFSFTMSPDGREIYFNRRGFGLLGCRHEDDGWTSPCSPAFLSGHPGAFEPHISPDGRRFFFGDGLEIWVAERNDSGWGEPRQVIQGMYATTTDDGTVYVTDTNPPPEFGTIVRFRPADGEYVGPEPVGGGVNLPAGSAHPCIVPDESFIVFDSVLPGIREGDEHTDLFVCFRSGDGSWGDAVNLGPEINTPGGNMCASLSPDGKYLFFQRYRDIYWVSAGVIERLRPD